MENLILIDIGGTTIKFGLNTGEKLELLPAKKTPKTLPEFYQCLEETVNELKKQVPIKGVALSCPGAVDQKTGVIGGTVLYLIFMALILEVSSKSALDYRSASKMTLIVLP